MADSFNPYYQWLGIAPEEQPATLYRLLGIKAFEENADVIDGAANRQMAHVRTFQTGKHAALSQQVLNEISRARHVLLDASLRAKYDQQLRAKTAAADVQAGLSGGGKPLAAWPDGKAPKTVAEFEQCLADSGILSFSECRACIDKLPENARPADPKALATELVKAGKLTKFQAAAAYQGKLGSLIFGEYIVLGKLGEGGMGQVLKAEHRRMRRTVALKVISPAALKSADSVRRFQREVHAAARLIHPNIVTAFDANETRGTHYLVMEYVEGRDLSQILKEQKQLPLEQAIDLTLQVARGLTHAHDNGIIHRDIKPSNLLIDKRGLVKILDMGLARIELADDGAQQLTSTGQVVGTVDFMAPEQALDTRTADGRADIYSLGCTLYRLVTGKNVYAGDTVMKKIFAHREAPVPSLMSSPDCQPTALLARVDKVFQRMVAKVPEDRYQTMAEVVVALEELHSDAAADIHSAPSMPPSAQDPNFSNFLAGLSAQHKSGQPGSSINVATATVKAPPTGLEETIHTGRLTEQTDSKLGSVAHEASSSSIPGRWKKVVIGGAGVGALAAAGLIALAIYTLSAGDEQVAKSEKAALTPVNSNENPAKAPVESAKTTIAKTELAKNVAIKEQGNTSGSLAVKDAPTPFLPPDALKEPETESVPPAVTPPETPAPPPVTEPAKRAIPVSLDAAGQATDLLKLVDPQLDSIQGGWYRSEQGIHSPTDAAALLQVPVTAPMDFKLALTVVRENGTGEIVIGIPFASKVAVLALFGREGVAALQMADGKPGGQTALGKKPRSLNVGEQAQCACVVSGKRLLVKLGEEIVVDWQGDPAELSLPPVWKPRDLSQFWLGTSASTCRFGQLDLHALRDKEAFAAIVRLPVPTKAESTKEQLKIRAGLKPSLQNATAQMRAAVAQNLMSGLPPATRQPAYHHAALWEVRTLAAAAGDAELAFRAIDELGKRFEEDPWRLKAEVISEAIRNLTDPVTLKVAVRKTLELVEAAEEADQYDGADRLLAAAEAIGVKLKDNDLRQMVRTRRSELKQRKSQWEATANARRQLTESPQDAAAHLAVGKFLCFVKGDWRAGLAHFARSGDPELVKLAELEQRLGSASPDGVKVAEEWWKFAKTAAPDMKVPAQAYAFDKCLDSLPLLASAQQRQTLVQLNSMVAEAPAIKPLPPKMGLKLWLASNSGVQQQKGLVYQWNDQSGHNHHAVQKDPKFCFTLVPNAVNGEPALRSRDATGQGLQVILPDIFTYEGLTIIHVYANLEARTGAETVIGIEKPVRWMFGDWGDRLGHVSDQVLGQGRISELNKPNLASFRFTRDLGWQVFFNGVDAGLTRDLAFPSSPTGVVIGSYKPNNPNEYPFGGDVCEVLVFDHPLSADEHRQVCSYLSLKYALMVHLPK